MIKFIFDLDGTITAQETLPLIAKRFGVQDEIGTLTKETVQGNVPFIESFIKRVHILGKLPVSEIAELLEGVALHGSVAQFISENKDKCVIATGNIDCWVSRLVSRIGCQFFGSEGIVKDNRVIKLTKILKKEAVVEQFQQEGYKVVFVGDGNNDIEAMRMADVAIAAGLTHYPAKSVLTVCDYLILNEKALCRQLNQLLSAVRALAQDWA
jgi:HAD superfamily phosphoserine phosphatase-like hydrolase